MIPSRDNTEVRDPHLPPSDEALLEGFMSQEQLCGWLCISKRTLHRWNLRRQGPPRIKVGNKILYSRRAVAEWLSSREQNMDLRRFA